jgi:hypothetical protein
MPGVSGKCGRQPKPMDNLDKESVTALRHVGQGMPAIMAKSPPFGEFVGLNKEWVENSLPKGRGFRPNLQTMNNKAFSAADFIALLCAAAIGVGFLVMPWLKVFGAGMTGIELLSEAQSRITNDISTLWLIPIAAGIGGLAALSGLASASVRKNTRVIITLAGLVGLAYYGLFFLQNSQSAIDVTRFVDVGFWVALFASAGLVIQILIPRPASY